jgi:polynucleotide 5'-kinase involved in rRNA processing
MYYNFNLFLKIGKRRFTFFSRHKESKSKKDAEKIQKESGKAEEDGRKRSKTFGGGGKKPKTKKEKETTPIAESKRSKHEQKKKERKKDRKNMRTLMIGLDDAGKTSILTMMLLKLITFTILS